MQNRKKGATSNLRAVELFETLLFNVI